MGDHRKRKNKSNIMYMLIKHNTLYKSYLSFLDYPLPDVYKIQVRYKNRKVYGKSIVYENNNKDYVIKYAWLHGYEIIVDN